MVTDMVLNGTTILSFSLDLNQVGRDFRKASSNAKVGNNNKFMSLFLLCTSYHYTMGIMNQK